MKRYGWALALLLMTSVLAAPYPVAAQCGGGQMDHNMMGSGNMGSGKMGLATWGRATWDPGRWAALAKWAPIIWATTATPILMPRPPANRQRQGSQLHRDKLLGIQTPAGMIITIKALSKGSGRL